LFVRVVNNIISRNLVPRSYLEGQTWIKFETQAETHTTPSHAAT